MHSKQLRRHTIVRVATKLFIQTPGCRIGPLEVTEAELAFIVTLILSSCAHLCHDGCSFAAVLGVNINNTRKRVNC